MVFDASYLGKEPCFVCFFFVAFLHGKPRFKKHPFVRGHKRKHYIQVKRGNFIGSRCSFLVRYFIGRIIDIICR